ncbi:MAG: activator of (R)-2-hydroxyglutaryl-CoA dehydratase [Acidobacteria bacterium]|nr:activator of (R)-2-hydroxyglutaryl-CoA dehydratase [Acidobacteriota bacterium]
MREPLESGNAIDPRHDQRNPPLGIDKESRVVSLQHFQRPPEKPFLAHERDKVTILFGGLTWKHERLITAVFRGSGYRCESLPVPDVRSFQIGKEYGNYGQCSPTYFTDGSLIQYLQRLKARGMSRQEIIDKYIFFTAGSCGPCRFGMYEAEYRFALKNAGFDGFRVLLFKQDQGIKAASGEPGLKFTCDFGLGILNALNLGDVINDLIYQIRPYEVNRGETERVFKEAVDELARMLRERPPFEILRSVPGWASRYLAQEKRRKLKNTLNSLGKIRENLYGKPYTDSIEVCREKLNSIEIDRTRVKPAVKITGEFWAQITEGDGNYNMFRFLEAEGAEVIVEPVGTFVTYLLHQRKMRAKLEKAALNHTAPVRWWQLKQRLSRKMKFLQRQMFLSLGDVLWTYFYNRARKGLGGIAHELIDQKELETLAAPFYNRFSRGGEGYLEVGKNVYYTQNRLAHMVLALKPFGCMPSLQSDGVQSAVTNHFKDMIFLPIETSGEGEVSAHSRVQMALAEAKAKARIEFEKALAATGRSMEQIREFVAEHPELRRPFYHIPHRAGIAGTAAQFVLHVSDLMEAKTRFRRRSRVRLARTSGLKAIYG